MAQARTKSLSHNVYVVELDRKVWTDDRRFRDANPHYRGIMGCLYVGMTSHSPKERFQKHVTGYRNRKGYKISSKYVERYGKMLRPSLYSSFNPMTRSDAADMEEQLAKSLRKRGFAVWWN